jgi:predicted type IV restriction endonuclease
MASKIGERLRIPNSVCIEVRKGVSLKSVEAGEDWIILPERQEGTKTKILMFNSKVDHPEADSLWYSSRS